jgi:pimeloyl-ACP methyl ester carboxylesterase
MNAVLRRTAGSGRPVKVLLLHGLGGRPATWDRFVDQVGDPVEVWVAELPWRSGATTEWAWSADQTPVLVDLLAGNDFDAVVAHSFAASLLTEAYAAGTVTPLPTVLVGACYRPRPDDFDWATISRYLNGFHRIFGEALQVDDTGRYPAKYRDWMAVYLRDQVGPYGWMRWFESYLRSPFLDLSTVTAPVLVTAGDGDIAAPPTDGLALAAALPHGRFVPLADCGHFPMLEKPDLMAQIVGDFLTHHCLELT